MMGWELLVGVCHEIETSHCQWCVVSSHSVLDFVTV